MENLYLEEYQSEMLSIMKQMHPELDAKSIKKIIKNTIEKRLQDPDVILDNNYTHETANTKLTSVLHWAMQTNPIIAGNGTFYKQHANSKNPDAEMVNGFLSDRDKIKKKMFSIGDETSFEYRDCDLKQTNKKKLANSFYGGSGMKASAFYSKWSGPATTLSAQSVISSTETTFEAFLVDNFIFIDLNECFTWLDHVLKEKVELDKWVKRVSLEDCVKRVSGKILGCTKSKEKIIYDYLKSYDQDTLTYIFYKNNLIEFTRRHEEVKELHRKIFENIRSDYEEIPLTKSGTIVDEKDLTKIPYDLIGQFMEKENPAKEWNKYVSVEKFYDPNTLPSTVKEYIEKLTSIYMKYIYVEFLSLDKIYRLRNFKRDVVTVIDTDSNILSLDTWMNFLFDEVIEGNSYGRSTFDNIFIGVNTITYLITTVVNEILLYYGKCSNIAEEYRSKFKMKNEFFFIKLVIAKTKKRYLSMILLREGNFLTKPKYDVKGFDLKKSTTSEYAEEVYMNIIKKYILDPEIPMVKEILEALYEFRKEVRESIMKGERKYLPNANAKELDAYKDPGSSQGVRGVLTWNMLEPDKGIEFPAKVSLLKMKLETEEEVEALKEKYPDKYKIIKDQIFHDTSGIFVKPRKIKGKSEMVSSGMKVLAIPTNESIPEWAIEFIDYTTIINTILAPFNSVLEIFDVAIPSEGKTGRKSHGLTNVINL